MPIIEWGDSGGGQGPTQGLAGPELLTHLEKTQPMVAAGVKSIINGDVNAGGRNLQKLIPVAALVDPTLQQYDYNTRMKTAQDFATGKARNNIKALDTATGHAERMIGNFEKLGNTWQPEFNSVKNWFGNRLGDGAVNAYETNANGVANELGTVFRSFGMSDAEVKSWRDRMTAANSPKQFSAFAREAMDMMKTRKEVLLQQWRDGMGDRPPPKALVSADLDRRMDEIHGRLEKIANPNGAQPAVPAPQQAAAPAPPQAAQPPMPGARQAPDGNWYVQQNGKFFKVQP